MTPPPPPARMHVWPVGHSVLAMQTWAEPIAHAVWHIAPAPPPVQHVWPAAQLTAPTQAGVRHVIRPPPAATHIWPTAHSVLATQICVAPAGQVAFSQTWFVPPPRQSARGSTLAPQHIGPRSCRTSRCLRTKLCSKRSCKRSWRDRRPLGWSSWRSRTALPGTAGCRSDRRQSCLRPARPNHWSRRRWSSPSRHRPCRPPPTSLRTQLRAPRRMPPQRKVWNFS